MAVFSWIMFGLFAVFGAGSLVSFLLFIFLDIPVWLDRARSLRRAVYLTVLVWFNGWIWGRIIWSIIHW